MSNYWEKRSVQRMYDLMELAEKKADELSDAYLKASRYIVLEIEKIFERFQKKHGLTEEEARKILEKVKDKTSIEKLFLAINNSDAKNNEWIAELESAAYRARMERLFSLQKEIDVVMMEIYKLEKSMNTEFLRDISKNIYYKEIFDIQRRLGFYFSFSHISEKQIRKVLSMNWSGLNYSDRIWNNTRDLANRLQTELLVNLLTGRTERETAEVIMDEFASGASNARRLIRTESNFVSSELNNMAYEEAGIEKYRYLATLDLKTSKVCRGLDGKVFLLKDRKVGVNCNPMHPWCRSTTVAEFDEEFVKDKKRRARDPKTGKNILVPQEMTYYEWYQKYVA